MLRREGPFFNFIISLQSLWSDFYICIITPAIRYTQNQELMFTHHDGVQGKLLYNTNLTKNNYQNTNKHSKSSTINLEYKFRIYRLVRDVKKEFIFKKVIYKVNVLSINKKNKIQYEKEYSK